MFIREWSSQSEAANTTFGYKGIGILRVKSKRAVPDSNALIKLRIKRDGRNLLVCLTYKFEVEDVVCGAAFPIPLARGIGIDMGVVDRAELSDGNRIAPINADRRRERRLQCRFARAVKGSNSCGGASGRIAPDTGAKQRCERRKLSIWGQLILSGVMTSSRVRISRSGI